MNNLKFILLVLIAIFMLIFNGCTFLGYGIGSNIDKPIIKQFDASCFELLKLKLGTPIILNLKDGNILDGLMIKLDSIPSEEYSRNYNRFLVKHSDNLWFPFLNDTIGINSNKIFGYVFKGFDYGSIKLKSITNDVTKNSNLDNIYFISNKNGKKLYTNKIKQYMKNGTLALYSNMMIKADIDTFIISNSQFIEGKIPSSYFGRISGILLGVTADIFVGALIAESMY